MMDPADEVEELIVECFERNLLALQAEGGHPLSPEVKETALQQVILYWRKLREIAEKVTDTEVRLSLPEQATPEGHRFGIEGVVDIVREHGRTVMYDLKTHDAELVRADPDPYERQLNVYAYIWQNLRNQPLDEIAVICTTFPEALQQALRTGSAEKLAQELARWNPVVSLDFSPHRVDETIRDLGRAVDGIEEGRFAPPPPEVLRAPRASTRRPFAVDVCVNCDARFSCSSYRAYAQGARGLRDRGFQRYYDETPSDEESADWVISALDASSRIEGLA